MKKELDALLCERYPLIFADRHGDMTKTCMVRGFECGDGWFELVDTLCACLQSRTRNNDGPQVVAIQVKEKMGVLAFYVDQADEEQWGMIAMAEAMSARICEECGAPGQVLAQGMFLTRCPAHAPAGAITRAEYYARRQAAKGENS